ncbi:hypothetical protein CUMW_091270, partial [Citrus unshiu]
WNYGKFDFASIAKATENFSSYNKLEEGRFGPVYKVILWHAVEIKSVKRRSKGSIQ